MTDKKVKPFKPHLATDADIDKLVFPVWAQYKIDGVRAVVKDEKCTGRSMKPCLNTLITDYFSDISYEGFDMEMGATKPNDPDLCRLTTSLTGTIKGGLPKFVIVFDFLHPSVIHLPYVERMEALEVWCRKVVFGAEVDIFISPQYKIENKADLLKFYQNALDLNYEGVVLRKQDGMHKSGRCTVREGNYLRIKPTGDAEGTLVRVEEAMENCNEAVTNALGQTERSSHKENLKPKGMIGALIIKDFKTGQEIKIGPGTLNHKQRRYYFIHQDELAQKIIKYKFLATGQKDKPRHARFFSFRNKEDL